MAECRSRAPRMQRDKKKATLQESLGLRVEETILYGNQWLVAQEEGVYGRGKAMIVILLPSNLVLAAKHLSKTMVQVLELAVNYYSRAV